MSASRRIFPCGGHAGGSLEWHGVTGTPGDGQRNGSAQPSAETTVATGTHQVERASALPATASRQAGPAAAEPVTLGSHPAAGGNATAGPRAGPDRCPSRGL